MKSLYAIDVGIGFTKRAYRQDEDSEVTVKSEASTLALYLIMMKVKI